MGKRTGIAAVLCVVAASVCGVAIAASSDDDSAGLLKDERRFREQALKDYSGGNKAGSAVNMEVVGHNDLGARGRRRPFLAVRRGPAAALHRRRGLL
jgi:hypothetical protein